jgi:hypothetical protein
MGNIGMAIAMTLTLGGLGLRTLIDAFFIMSGLRKANERIEREMIQRIQTIQNARNNDAAATRA